jgi:sodium-dependent dicarboxylate transporter 2/3/5
MATTQLALLFFCGYLLSRLFVVSGLPGRIVYLLVIRELNFSRLIFLLISMTAALSVLIPNAITAITVLPIITLLERQWAQHGKDHRARVTTALALAVIYGANIGGTGAITATPANGILAAYAALKGVDSDGLLRFDSWLLWGLPLAAILVVIGWLVIMLTLGGKHAGEKVEALQNWQAPAKRVQGYALWLAAGFFVCAFALSSAMNYFPGEQALVLGLTVLVTVLLSLVLFALPLRQEDSVRAPLMKLSALVSGMPLRGLLFVAGFVTVATLLVSVGAVQFMARLLADTLPAELDSFGAMALIGLITSFCTELLSNTVVQLGMFETILAHGAPGNGLIYPLLVATLSCTCAFMSPLATGVNGLVFGEMRGASILRMLLAGILMNLAAAFTISAWVHWVVR